MNRTIYSADGEFVETVAASEANNKLIVEATRVASINSKTALTGSGGTVGPKDGGGEPVRINDADVLCVNGLTIDYDF